MTSPHDEVPQEPTWASPTGPAADAVPPAQPAPAPAPPTYVPPTPPPAYGQQQPPVYGQPTQPPVYGQQPPVYGQPTQPPVYGQQPPVYGQPTPPPVYGQQPPPGWGGPPVAPPVGWGQPMAPPPGASWRPPALQPGIIPLRPIGLGEIYDGAFRAIRANPKVMFGMSALVVTVAVALQSLVGWYVAGLLAAQFANLGDELDPTGAAFGTAGGSADLGSSLGDSVARVTALPITTLATTVLTGLLIVSVSRSVLGQVVTIRDVLRSGRVWLVVAFSLLLAVAAVVVTSLAVGLVALLGVGGYIGLAILFGVLFAFVFFVAVFWVNVRTLLTTPALMLEGKRFWPTIARSWRLTRGSFWRLLGIWLLTSILASIIGAVFTFPASLVSQLILGDVSGRSFGSILINGVASIIALTLSTTFVAAVTALLYIDVRMRREGLDVELARAAEQTA